MADGDLVGADEDILDEQPQDTLTFGSGRGAGLVFQAGEEVLDVVGEGEVDLSVSELAIKGAALLAQAGLAAAQLGHPGSEFVEGDQPFLVGADQPLDGLGGFAKGGVETLALDGGRVGGAGLVESFGDLGADQGRVGQQPADVVPDDGVEVVGTDGFVGADAPCSWR